jgi:hypothetical protein
MRSKEKRNILVQALVKFRASIARISVMINANRYEYIAATSLRRGALHTKYFDIVVAQVDSSRIASEEFQTEKKIIHARFAV